MARGRMLNKTVAISPKFAALSNDTCRLLATWTIAHLDKYGVFYGRPGLVKGHIFPEREDISISDVGRYMNEMEAAGLIRLFKAKDGTVWQYWPGFAENQVGLRADRESSSFPPPPRSAGDDPSSDRSDSAGDDDDAPPQSGDDPDNFRITSGNLPDESGINTKGSTREVEVEGKENLAADAAAPESGETVSGSKESEQKKPAPTQKAPAPSPKGSKGKTPKFEASPIYGDLFVWVRDLTKYDTTAGQNEREVGAVAKWLDGKVPNGLTLEKAKMFGEWWALFEGWRGAPPTPNQITKAWGRFEDWLKEGKPAPPAQHGKAANKPTIPAPEFKVSMEEVKARRATALWAPPQGGTTK